MKVLMKCVNRKLVYTELFSLDIERPSYKPQINKSFAGKIVKIFLPISFNMFWVLKRDRSLSDHNICLVEK